MIVNQKNQNETIIYLQNVRYQGRNKHVVQMKILVGQNVFQAPPGAVGCQDGHVSVIDTCTNEWNQVFMTYFSDLNIVIKKQQDQNDLKVNQLQLRMSRTKSGKIIVILVYGSNHNESTIYRSFVFCV